MNLLRIAARLAAGRRVSAVPGGMTDPKGLSVTLTMPDGTSLQHDPTLPAPEGYDPGDEKNYPEVITEVAFKRAAAGISGDGSAEVVLPAEAGYGAMIENADDLILLSKSSSSWSVEMGPNEHEMESIGGPFPSLEEAIAASVREIR